ncbi:hypothetical protein M434DRAFT_35955 [Hypoxylon sp. CO27-5]|nr:hypothetical protein M434DRAFT_35955 [Hypoxylon sp. CO27-5]
MSPQEQHTRHPPPPFVSEFIDHHPWNLKQEYMQKIRTHEDEVLRIDKLAAVRISADSNKSPQQLILVRFAYFKISSAMGGRANLSSGVVDGLLEAATSNSATAPFTYLYGSIPELEKANFEGRYENSKFIKIKKRIYECEKIVLLLIENEPDFEDCIVVFRKPLHLSGLIGNESTVRELLVHRADVNLHHGCPNQTLWEDRHPDMMDALAEHRADNKFINVILRLKVFEHYTIQHAVTELSLHVLPVIFPLQDCDYRPLLESFSVGLRLGYLKPSLSVVTRASGHAGSPVLHCRPLTTGDLPTWGASRAPIGRFRLGVRQDAKSLSREHAANQSGWFSTSYIIADIESSFTCRQAAPSSTESCLDDGVRFKLPKKATQMDRPRMRR